MTDVNDVDPTYAQDSYYALVDEDASVNDPVVTATCTDDSTSLSYRYKRTTVDSPLSIEANIEVNMTH